MEQEDKTITIPGDGAVMKITLFKNDALHDFYGITFIKDKYSTNKRIPNDILLFTKEKMDKLYKHLINNVDETLSMRCNCGSEILHVRHIKDDSVIVFELYDNYWLSNKFHKKLAQEFIINDDEIRYIASSLFLKNHIL